MEESLIYRGIAATYIKYTEEDIENLLNREINLREKENLECHPWYANYLG